MKRKIISKMVTAGLVALAGSASANIVEGIDLGQPGFSFQFADIFEQANGGGPITAVGQELVGYGEVSSIRDNTGGTSWSRGDNGRELTFEFGGFIASFVSPSHIDFTGGWVNFYSDTAQNFDPTAGAGTGYNDGTLWLSLVGVSQDFGGTHITDATLHSTGTLLGSTILSGTGVGLMDVIGGPAGQYLDTNTIAYTSSTGSGFADVDFNSSFTNLGSSLFDLQFNGTANLRGFQVPEPATLSLLGLSLAGLGAMARKKKKA